MESSGILKMYKRSRSERQLEYVGYVGDGDSKSFVNLQNEKVYGDQVVTKKECVGHVQKRCGKKLRDLKAKSGTDKLSDGKTIGGKERLTSKRIYVLQTYYGLAIRRNKGGCQRYV